ncbi:sugar ABC transporter ATP-binding protein [Photobacterium sp. GJ3]|uniref:sugar ABC transporter ATP-binding protein n=1 Tax=Photobacterium sp. GJ3 TaxID=2829502 RepID=UPI001B8B610D|nr:sugar ABC transporter ATP-binding protein [Photobacterium sp. GJ3]QUJ67848.1 sugar ABC transporter ATP-binding protein [Photobacterium sp. GJ3]
MNDMILLEAQGITKAFSGVPALKNGQLVLRAGSVHALCGGNGAGKSTFLNILMGLYSRDNGTIHINSAPVQFTGPADALKAGISMISQELEPIPDMTVAENIYLGREPRRAGVLVNYHQMNQDCAVLMAELQMAISPTALMRDLSLAQIQLVEIAKAISCRSRILIMDEPTSAIGEQETEILFEAIQRLKSRGAGIIYVSHRMNELYRIADEYTIFRDGEFIGSGKMADIDRHTLVNTILGAELEEEFAKFNQLGDDRLLEVTDLTRAGMFDHISLNVREGEILGIFGLMGAGRSEFLEALFGLHPVDKGEIKVRRSLVSPTSPIDAMQAGLALVTEDRKASGLCLDASVAHNIALASLPARANAGVVKARAEQSIVQKSIQQFSIKTASADLPVRSLSGGNQQKVVLAKWMQTAPSILLLDEPTRGVDVGAKREIYHFMSEFARDEKAIIMVSSEIPEIIGMCDRVVVFKRGKVSGELTGDEITQEQLARLAS